jgi:hypothetical protein
MVKPFTEYAILVTLGTALAFNILLFYTNAKAMLWGGGVSEIHWNDYGEGWPEFVFLAFLCFISFLALIGFFREVD